MSSTELVIDRKDLDFVINDWLKIGELSKYKQYEDFDTDTITLLLKEGYDFAENVMFPTRAPADREGCKLVNERVVVPACLHEPYKKAYELGWANVNFKTEYGGMGAPLIIGIAIREGLLAASISLSMYFGLTEGAAGLIEAFAADKYKEKYLHNMINGSWTGTMCLSEPHAGSDVGASSSVATKIDDEHYKIKGTKCWISSGDSDLSSNTVHLVLARIKGAPAGTAGLSLFIVPYFTVNEDGSIGKSNDVTVAAVEHKMGITASATCVLNFGDNDNCIGELVGKEGNGIKYMFKLMNEARIGTAAIALGGCAAAYNNALAYAKERVQGSHINQMRNPHADRVKIIEHPDVRYNLMTMKANLEAFRALLYATVKIWDLVYIAETEEERNAHDDLFQILTPMCKGWGCEVAIDIARIGVQVFGGVGYTKDFQAEQLYRDVRITAIYEGTTGIQGLDLLGRKMTMKNGALFMSLLGKFDEFVTANSDHSVLGAVIKQWGEHCEAMADVAMNLQNIMQDKGIDGAALYATPFLHFISNVTAGYYFLQQALLASEKLEALKTEKGISADKLDAFVKENTDATFYDNKLKTVSFFVNILIPIAKAKCDPVLSKNFVALDINL